MRSSDLSCVIWRKSSRSNDGGGGDCVEVAGLRDEVALRDSKNPAGPMLAITRSEWRAFLGSIQAGEFGRLGPPPPVREDPLWELVGVDDADHDPGGRVNIDEVVYGGDH